MEVYSTVGAFAAILADRSLVAWGHRDYGGSPGQLKAELKSVDFVVSSEQAFAANHGFGKWTNDFNDGTRWIRKLVTAFYSNEFSFGRFMRDHPQHRGNLTDLLIGRIFHEEAGRIFDDLDPALEKRRAEVRQQREAATMSDQS